MNAIARLVDRAGTSRLLAATLLLAFLVRVVWVLTLEPQIQWFDGKEYARLAQGLVEHHAYLDREGRPTAFWPPGYPFFLAAIYTIFGVGVTAARLVEAVLGTVICLLAYGIGREVAGRRTGLLAALLAAVYPLHIYIVGSYFATTLQTALVGGAVWSLMRAVARGSGRWAVAAGVLGAWATLTAASVLPALLLAAAWLATEMALRGRRRAGARLALLFLLPIGLTLGGWMARNAQVLDHPVLVSTNGGGNFWVGNYPGVTAATGNRWTPEMRAEWLEILARHEDEVEQDRALYARGREFVVADPWRFVTLSFSKAIRLWWLYPQPMADHGQPDLLVVAGSVGSYGLLLIPALIGLGRALPRRREARLVLLVCIAYSAVHAIYISKVRLRLPLDTFVIVYAAATIGAWLGLDDAAAEKGLGRPRASDILARMLAGRRAADRPPADGR